MNHLQTQTKNSLEYCRYQKRLDEKTLKAYRIDLTQFYTGIAIDDVSEFTTDTLENFIANLYQKYKPKTEKRKITVIKAFFHPYR